jgi:hypothetical protein
MWHNASKRESMLRQTVVDDGTIVNHRFVIHQRFVHLPKTMDPVGIWASKFIFGGNMALEIPNNLFFGGNSFHTPQSRLRNLSRWPSDGLSDIEKSDRTFDRNATSPRVVAVASRSIVNYCPPFSLGSWSAVLKRAPPAGPTMIQIMRIA